MSEQPKGGMEADLLHTAREVVSLTTLTVLQDGTHADAVEAVLPRLRSLVSAVARRILADYHAYGHISNPLRKELGLDD